MSDLELWTGARVLCAAAGLAVAMTWERLRPLRALQAPGRHDARNLTLWGLDSGLLALLPVLSSLGAARLARQEQIGIFQQLDVPWLVELALVIVALDAATWGLHRLYHWDTALWRVHRVHHSDPDLTSTTGVRFHPIEILVSALVRVPAILALGAGPWSVFGFEALLLLSSQFQHAGVRLPARVDRVLRWGVVTPNLHRVHHSVERAEADSNFGTILTLWDRLAGTLRVHTHPEAIAVGLPEPGPPEPLSVGVLIAMPFRRLSGIGQAARLDGLDPS